MHLLKKNNLMAPMARHKPFDSSIEKHQGYCLLLLHNNAAFDRRDPCLLANSSMTTQHISQWKSWSSFAGNALPINQPAWTLCLAIYISLDH
jgi:hypothetical protein